MDPLVLLLQLTFYGLKLSESDFSRLLARRATRWSQILECIESEVALQRLRDEAWCSEIWRRLESWARQHRLEWTYPGEPSYPGRLLRTSEPPKLLCYQGAPAWENFEILSVVGSREPMRDSIEWMRHNLLGLLRDVPIAIASGGARGIDAWAHEFALLAGRPTICFLPSGILRAYPSKHAKLFERIVKEGGCLLSGFAPDAEMRKQFFHQRNRWIAGISLVTFVVEAQRKSGSLLTARLALEEGRSVCTLPVSALAHQGLGNLDLISDGAQILRDKNDLAAFIGRELRGGA